MNGKMKSIVLRYPDGVKSYQFESVNVPVLGENEVLIRLKAAAFNRRDIFITQGKYPGIQLPAIPGSDGSGEVVEVGENVHQIPIGRQVIIYPAINWGDSERVYGPTFSVVGMPTDGTFAEFIKVPVENVYSKPDHLTWEEAAAIPLGGLTAYRALITRGQIKKGDNVLIPGIGGGVATFLLQIAVAKGANVFVTSSSDEKIKKAISLGAVGGINYREDAWEKKLFELMEDGFDLCVDSIGGESFRSLLKLAKHGSRIVTIGSTAGPIPQLLMPHIFLKQIDILGSTLGSPREFGEMLSFFFENHIGPIIDSIYPFDSISDAFNRIEKGQNFGKVVLTFG